MRFCLGFAALCRVIPILLVCVSSGCKGSNAATSASTNPGPSTPPTPSTPPPATPTPPASEFTCQGVEGTDEGAAPELPRCPAPKAVTNAHCQAAGLLHYFSEDLCIESCLPPDQLKGNECCSLIDAVGRCCRTELDEEKVCLPPPPGPPGSRPDCPAGRVYTCSTTNCRCR